MKESKASGSAKGIDIRKLIVPGGVMLAFWTLAAVIWLATGELMALFFFGYIGTSVGVGLGLYAVLPKKKKPLGRRLALFPGWHFPDRLCCHPGAREHAD